MIFDQLINEIPVIDFYVIITLQIYFLKKINYFQVCKNKNQKKNIHIKMT